VKKAVMCLILAGLVMVFTAAFAFAADFSFAGFSDVDAATDVGEAIYKMQEIGHVNGYGDGTFHPGGYITRAELTKLVNGVFGYTAQGEVSFQDVSSAQWFYSSIAVAKAAGYISGFPDGSFRPNENVTRQEMCAILNRIINFTPLPFETAVTDAIAPWAKADVMAVLSNRVFLVGEDGFFGATQPITRGEVCLGLANFLPENLPEEEASPAEKPEKEAVFAAMQQVVSDLEKYVLNPPAPQSISPEEKVIVAGIIENMKACMADTAYDYKPAAEAAYQEYLALTEEQRDNLKYLITYYNDTSNLLLLQDFFF